MSWWSTRRFPAKTVPEFIAYAKANPGKINMASAGNGSAPHVFGELFKMMAGVDLVHVPYRGSPLADLLGGQVQVVLCSNSSVDRVHPDGKLRALAVTTATRSEVLPDIPPWANSCRATRRAVGMGVGAPKSTSTEIIEKLNKEINAVLADPKMKARLADLGLSRCR